MARTQISVSGASDELYRAALFGFEHKLQAFHRAGLATVACYAVLLVTSAVTQRERDGAREHFTWRRFRAERANETGPVRPWWQRDRLWAAVLIVITLVMCWYFA